MLSQAGLMSAVRDGIRPVRHSGSRFGDSLSPVTTSWVLSRSSFLLGNLGNTFRELLLNLRSKAYSDLHPCPLTGTSHPCSGIRTLYCPDPIVA